MVMVRRALWRVGRCLILHPMQSSHLLMFLLAAAASAAAVPAVRWFAIRAGAIDAPDAERKRHARPTPLFGGLAAYAGIIVAVAAAITLGLFPGVHLHAKYLVGIVLALSLLVFGGAWDDVRPLPASRQLMWPLLAVAVVITSGIGITTITNPFGGLIHLDQWRFIALWWDGIPYRVTVFADLFTLAWLMTMTYTTKLLDGLDGLVAGIAVIGGLVVAGVSFLQDVAQPDTALLALIVAGAFLGLLPWNAHPARIFLGESGSTMAGFLLGTLGIISGGKIATTLLVLGLPLFDAAVVVFRRLARGASPFSGDRLHLHFRLVEWGFTQRQAVLLYYLVATLFGTSTLVLRGPQKVVALGAVMLVLAATIAAGVVMRARAKRGTSAV